MEEIKGETFQSSVFTLVGYQKPSPSYISSSRDCARKLLPSRSLSKPLEGTYYSVSATPTPSPSPNRVSSSHTFKSKVNDSEKSKSSTTNVVSKHSHVPDKDDPEIDKKHRDLNISVNDDVNFKISVPQDLPIESIQEICHDMIEADHSGRKFENNQSSTNKNNDHKNEKQVDRRGGELIADRKPLPTLKSPIIVKEIIKKISGLPSGGFKQADKLKIVETQPEVDCSPIQTTLSSGKMKQINSVKETSSGEEINVVKNIKSNVSSNTTPTTTSSNPPIKPPRINSEVNHFHHIKLPLSELNEKQSDNLIEEIYLNEMASKEQDQDENQEKNLNGHCIPNSSNDINIRTIDKSSLEIEKKTNIVDVNENKQESKDEEQKEEINDLDCAIVRASCSSVDSGMSGTSSHPTHFIVVAIDFGTTFSGYAFSFMRDPDNIHMMRKVGGGDPDVSNQKIPTILLLQPDGTFHSFGYNARDFFHNLDSKEAQNWFYFEKFKMTLHNSESLTLDTKIKSTNGSKIFPAITIFAHALRYFKLRALQELSDQTAITIINEDVRWVVTVPAIWKQSAKQFMRAAAYEAGVCDAENPEQLLIALEPEAASIYCRKVKLNQLMPEECETSASHVRISIKGREDSNEKLAVETEQKSFNASNNLNCFEYDYCIQGENAFIEDTRYMVVDCGGGTVDITVHEILNNQGSLKEIHKATGGPFGSIGVDMCFEKLLSDIFGNDFWCQFKRKMPTGYLDLMASFEARKRSANPFQSTTTNISLPFSFISFYKKFKGHSVESRVKKCSTIKGITYCPKLGMLRLEQNAMQSLFESVTNEIMNHIKQVFINVTSKHPISHLFLVGGFSESAILQKKIRDTFSHQLKVIIPQFSSIAILFGAVLFGIDPSIVSVRRSRMTYGVGVLNKFSREKHPVDKLVVKDNVSWCTDVFDQFVICDQSVALNESVTRSYTPAKEGQTCCIIHIYCTERDDAQFITDEGVQRCGTLFLDLQNIQVASQSQDQAQNKRSHREIQTKMIFGDTEIKVSATDVLNGKCVKAQIDFLNQ